MCGIVGILGKEAVATQVVEALRRLEYRGYDSAGVATLEAGQLTRRRAEGKLKNLEIRLSNEPLEGLVGIGHTRWATHGKPNETNAHPHATPRLAVVHNDIIENFRELRAELQADGYVFETETDTELLGTSMADARPGATTLSSPARTSTQATATAPRDGSGRRGRPTTGAGARSAAGPRPRIARGPRVIRTSRRRRR